MIGHYTKGASTRLAVRVTARRRPCRRGSQKRPSIHPFRPGFWLVDVSIDGYVGPDGRGGWAVVVEGRTAASGATSGEPSHLVEWRAASAALAWLERRRGPDVERRALEVRLVTDSALVERGLSARKPAMSGEAAEVRARCRQAIARLAAAGVRVQVVRVPREENAAADAAARQAARADDARGPPD